MRLKRLTAGDAQLVIDETMDLSGTTEARSNVHTFLTVLQAGGRDPGAEGAGRVRPDDQDRRIRVPPGNSPVLTELVAEAKAAYAKMSRTMQAEYRAAVNAAIAEHPPAWITALKFFR